MVALGLLTILFRNSVRLAANWDVQDPSLKDKTYKVSTRFRRPSSETLARPVLIAVHGYAASTFEWQEFREFAESHSRVLVSQVLLGGHGRDLKSFDNASWQDWEKPVLEEYKALKRKGYKHISFAGSSVGATLLLHEIASGNYQNVVHPPEHFFLIDPYVIPQDRLMAVTPYLGFFGQNPTPEEGQTPLKYPKWFFNRPSKALVQLNELTNQVSQELEVGLMLPTGSRMVIYQSMGDTVSNPKGADLIQEHVRGVSGNVVRVEWVNSRHHVFTQGRARKAEEWSLEDKENQEKVFKDMIALVTPTENLVPTPNPRPRHKRKRSHR